MTEQFYFINEEFFSFRATPEEMDALWSEGWRHFGAHFFRYNLGFYEYEIRRVIPLRVRLADFKFSKSQRRVLNKNTDLQAVIRPVRIDSEKENLFERHKRRFKSGVPGSIYDFLSEIKPDAVPCDALEVAVFDPQRGNLLAASFFDVGKDSISSIYAMFEPTEERRSLGILTMLLEIRYAREAGKKYYYSGYAYEGNSFYDYKKRFSALESFDWQGGWEDFAVDSSGKQ